VEEHQARADEVERTCAEGVQRVVEDVVPDDLEVRELEPGEVPRVEVGRDHVSGRAHLSGQPHRHRATAGADLEAAPAGLHQGATRLRGRVVDLLEQVQPRILLGLPTRGGEAVVTPGSAISAT
jgi:hypothetical protein